MSYDLVEIAGRVQRLERDNRRLKLGAGGLVAVLVALPLVAAALPAQVPDVIDAREFRVVDGAGTRLADLNEYGLGFYDDEQVESRAFLSKSGLGFYDEQGMRAALIADRLVFFGEDGQARLRLGRITLLNPSTYKAEMTYPAALVLYDEEGDVIESLPR